MNAPVQPLAPDRRRFSASIGPSLSRAALCLALSACLLAPLSASAQRTGGSFGGGSFHSSGSSSSSSPSYHSSPSSSTSSSSGSSGFRSSSSSGSSSGSSYSDSSSGGGPSAVSPPTRLEKLVGIWAGPLVGLVCVLIVGGFAFYLRPGGSRRARRAEIQLGRSSTTSSQISSWMGMDVTAISVALDSSSRRFVQQRLMALAKDGDTDTPAGLAQLCRQTSKLLREVSPAWLYAGAKNYDPMDAEVAERTFRALATDFRARFRHEVVRAEGGDVREASAPEQRARPEEGEGLAVVTMIVAARTELFDLADPRSVDELQIALTALGMLADGALVALEVVWSPAEENDRMSSAELEMLYPELGKVDESRLAGRVVCASCAGPYAAELGACPHCGAPPARRNG